MLRLEKLTNSLFSRSLTLCSRRTFYGPEHYSDPKTPLFYKYRIQQELISPLNNLLSQAAHDKQGQYFEQFTKQIFADETYEEIKNDQPTPKKQLPIQTHPPMHIEDFSEHIIEEVEKNIKKSTSKIYFFFQGWKFLHQCYGFLVRLAHINTLKKNSENQALIGSLKKDKKYLLSCAQINYAVNFDSIYQFQSFSKTCKEYEIEFTKIVNNSELFQMRNQGYHKVIVTPRSSVHPKDRFGVQILEVRNMRFARWKQYKILNALDNIDVVLNCQRQKINKKFK